MLAEAVRRGQAFLEAGAPVVFVPGVVAREEIAALVEGLGPRKLTVISVPGASLPARELEELGVARVSTGPVHPAGGADRAAGRRHSNT